MGKRVSAARVLIYSQDGFGLGHLRRNLNISLQIKKQCPAASVLIIADSPVAPFFKLPPKCDFIKVPTIVKVDAGVWRPNGLPMDYAELLQIRSDIIQNVALSFRPHIFLVDHMPHGALGELAEPLRVLKHHYPATQIILGLRDILGAQDVIHKTWVKEGAFDAAASYYDKICIYGCADIFDLLKEYRFPEGLKEKAAYCGYVARDASRGPKKQQIWQKVLDVKEKLILVTGGGGADASYFMDKFIEAAALLHKTAKFRAIVAAGPFLHAKQFRFLQRKARNLPIVVTRSGSDNINLLKRADLVLSMAGYNTISEIMRFRKNAIAVPRSGPSAEQTMRTELLSRREILGTIHPNHLTAECLAAMIAERLENGREIQEEKLPNLRGAQNAAQLMLSSVNK